MANEKLVEQIKEVHAEFKGKYGSPRIHQELQEEREILCSKNRVARLMRENGIQAVHKRRFSKESLTLGYCIIQTGAVNIREKRNCSKC